MNAVRRAGTVPMMVLLTVVLVVLLPLVAIVSCVSVVGFLIGRPPRFRAVRLHAFATLYALGECGCLLACVALWLLSPLPGQRDPDRWARRHARLLQGLLGMLIRGAEMLFAFRLRLEGPPPDSLDDERPLIVLGRHAGPGASLVLVHLLLERHRRIPRIVLKQRLRLDPALDVLLGRIGCAFLGPGDSARAVGELAHDLRTRDALLIYPEGSDWTPTRHRLAVRKLRLRGLRARANAAERRPHVLPPRPGGTFAALANAPDAQVAVFMHTGHDDLLEAGALWRALPLRRGLRMTWWNEPRPEVSTEAECGVWLDTLWSEIDSRIAARAA